MTTGYGIWQPAQQVVAAQQAGPNGQAPPPGTGIVAGADGRPVIIANQDQGDLIADARGALAAVNSPPRLFLRSGVLARIGSDDDGRTVLMPLTAAAIRSEMARLVQWVKISEDKPPGPSGVPPIVVDDLISNGDQLSGIPVIGQVVTAPVFGPDGTLITAPGYNHASRTWYEPSGGVAIPPVSDRPTRQEIAAAARFLMAEYLGDFPFDGEPSRQHALGTLLLPFARLMIDGPVPLQCTDAATPGTGKGLLQRAMMFPALGSMLPALPGVLGDEEELRKKITTALMRGQQVIRWDNITSRVDSAVLSSVLTEPVWQDRLLGLNIDVAVQVRAIFLANGNNLRYSHEIARRVVPVRLDLSSHAGGLKDAEAPWRRTGFRHPSLIEWAAARRGLLVHAALTLIQGWIAAGRPPGTRSLGSYEQWSRVIGGIVEHAAGPRCSGFLLGLDDLYASTVDERDEKIAFLEAWHGRFGARQAAPAELAAVLYEADPFGITGSGSDRSQQTRLGHELAKMRGQVWGGWQVTKTKTGRKWTVKKVASGLGNMQPCATLATFLPRQDL